MQEHSGANPYAAPAARIEENFALAGDSDKASRLTRLGAYIVDALIIGVWFIPAYIPMLDQDPATAPGMVALLSALVGFGLIIVNFVMLHRSGQTIAKRWFGVRIVRKDGSRAGFGRIFALRMLVPGVISAIPLLGAVFSLVDALFIFAEDRRTLHDRIADTIVVNA